MKTAGIVLIWLTAAAAGFYAADRYIKRYRLLMLIDRLIDRAAVMIRCTASPVEDIIRAAAEDRRLSGLEFIVKTCSDLERGGDLRAIWKENLHALRADTMLDEEFAILEDMGNILGSGDCESQLSALAGQKHILAGLIAEADRERHEKPRLCRSIGILAGMFAAVILI